MQWAANGSFDLTCSSPFNICTLRGTQEQGVPYIPSPKGQGFTARLIKEGFERLTMRYNSLQELQSRSDSGIELLRLYEATDLQELSTNDRFSTIRLAFLEMALSQDSVLETLNKDDFHRLILECFNKAKTLGESYSGHFSTATTIYLGVNCLYRFDNVFTEIVDSSEALTALLETSVLNLSALDDATLGRVVIHFQSEYLGGITQ